MGAHKVLVLIEFCTEYSFKNSHFIRKERTFHQKKIDLKVMKNDLFLVPANFSCAGSKWSFLPSDVIASISKIKSYFLSAQNTHFRSTSSHGQGVCYIGNKIQLMLFCERW